MQALAELCYFCMFHQEEIMPSTQRFLGQDHTFKHINFVLNDKLNHFQMEIMWVKASPHAHCLEWVDTVLMGQTLAPTPAFGDMATVSL